MLCCMVIPSFPTRLTILPSHPPLRLFSLPPILPYSHSYFIPFSYPPTLLTRPPICLHPLLSPSILPHFHHPLLHLTIRPHPSLLPSSNPSPHLPSCHPPPILPPSPHRSILSSFPPSIHTLLPFICPPLLLYSLRTVFPTLILGSAIGH